MLTKFLRNDRLTLRATKAHFGIFSPRPEVTGAMSASDGYLIVEDLRAKAAQVRRADDRENGLRAASLMARVREVRQRRRLRLRTTN
jgi:hypothetical protein